MTDFVPAFSNKELSSNKCGAREILLEIELVRAYAHIKKIEALKAKADYIVSELLRGRVVSVTDYLEVSKELE